jgi:hypothetical protein
MTDDPWQQNVEVFPALLRTKTAHITIQVVAALVVLILAAVTNLWVPMLLLVAALLGLGYLIARYMSRLTLFTSDAGLVVTDGVYCVDVPWADICCLRRQGSSWERWNVLSFQMQRIRELQAGRPVSRRKVLSLLNVRSHRMMILTHFGANPLEGRFKELLQIHRPELVPSGPLPISKRQSLCQHQLGAGSSEYHLRRSRRILFFAVSLVALGLTAVLAIAAHSLTLLVLSTIGVAWIVIVIAGSPNRQVLKVSESDGLSESLWSMGAINVSWEEITQIRQVRIGLVNAWVAEFPPRAVASVSRQPEIFPVVRNLLLKRGGGARINLTDYGLSPGDSRLGPILASRRPDLTPNPKDAHRP